jgi:hypothetical protein
MSNFADRRAGRGLGEPLSPRPPDPFSVTVRFAGPWGCARGEERESPHTFAVGYV